MRDLGIDYRYAVRDVYRDEGLDADWIWSRRDCDFGSLRDFAAAADVHVVCPAIGQPWSYQCNQFHAFRELDEFGPGSPIRFDFMPARIRRIALFHGSYLLQPTAEQYADLYRNRGYTIAATTLDYVRRMGAVYLPPLVSLEDVVGDRAYRFEPARPRQDGEPLRVIHAPTNEMCQWQEVGPMIRNLGLEPGVMVCRAAPHPVCMAYKSKAHAGYDHLRGAFSINSVENAALGLVNLVGLRAEYREWMRANGWEPPDWPRIETAGDVHDTLLRLRDSAEETRRWQERGRRWYCDHFSPEAIAGRVAEAYTG
jgi:hypothetical protein